MGKRPVLPHRTLRFRVAMNISVSLQAPVRQAGTQTPFSPEITGPIELPLPPCTPWLLQFVTGQSHCPLCTVTALLPGGFGRATKDLCPCQKLSAQCNPSPLSHRAGLPCLGWKHSPVTAPHKPKPVPLPSTGSFCPYPLLQASGEQWLLWGTFNFGEFYPDLLKGWVWVSARLCPQSLYATFPTEILQDHLNIRVSNSQVYSCLQEARNLADWSHFT